MKITGAVLEEMGRARPYAKSQPISVGELELEGPGPDEVLVKIEAAGVCHSDLSVVEGNRERPLPILLGHEAAGVVIETGAEVTDLQPEQRVVTVFLARCGECEHCATNGKLPCIPGTAANNNGVLLNGVTRLSRGGETVQHHQGVSGFATHAVLNRRSVVPVDSDVPPAVAAVLGCAVLTGGGAVVNAGKPVEGQDVMIVGLGGVGMAALLTAVSLAAASERSGQIIGVDANPAKLTRARELGATSVYSPQEIAEQGIKAPVVIEAAGHPKAFEAAVEATAAGGTTVTVGLPSPAARSSIAPLVITAEARTIIGSYLGSAIPSQDIPAFAQMWREGRLPVEELVSAMIRLEDINQAMDDLADGKAVRQIILF
ncbi:alcohol dehydrogenase catalytic domain-containing protein [Arthrobacter sp. H14]|uniref:alcohol dehydrogenase catalytic domain-containing protein n=1 Tax=Arthrobacter sp. H14 TaxID=1312959 RepID=UPI000479E9E7|nr:alcohol dehydrogenase catalytic domain-containing protein [Arthrobacter sp. H14]